ncbi:MAG: NAD(P)-binding domain-containing protein [Dehalococcoidia bacterium]|nr:NAD(P)-binding domain-containing protein [Dehalococcoidia bacterium]
MRIIIYGAGGIGGGIGARLALAGHEVVLICRGQHLEAINSRGLLLKAPDGEFRVAAAAVGHPREVDWREGDVVLLAMKTQDTETALRDLEQAAGTAVPVFCAQNGVENERLASRRFEHVYATLVAMPATFLVPGEVIASAAPLSGCLHSGRYPAGSDVTAEEVCGALASSHFHAQPSTDAMALKYRKLILNLGNGVEVIVGRSAWSAGGELGEFVEHVREEALECYQAAGIVPVSSAEYAERVTSHYRAQDVGGESRSASSTLQSILRGHETTEVDYLNGEIELIGHLHGVPTPYNSVVREVATRMAAARAQPGSVTLEELRAMVAATVNRRAARP